MSFACEDASIESERPFGKHGAVAAPTYHRGFRDTIWNDFPVVFLAALVGTETSSKLTILASLSRKLNPGTLVVARSARGLRSVLYPVSLNHIDAMFTLTFDNRFSSSQILNSVVSKFWPRYTRGRKL